MTTIKFDEFYTRIKPFIEEEALKGKTLEASGQLVNVAIIEMLALLVAKKAVDKVALRIQPNSSWLKRQSNRLDVTMWDRAASMGQHGIILQAMAYRLPENLKTHEFVCYARSLFLPYTAKIIEEGIRLSPSSTAQTPEP